MRTSKNLRRMFGALFFGAMMLMPLAACEDDGLEEAGEEVGDAVEEATD